MEPNQQIYQLLSEIDHLTDNIEFAVDFEDAEAHQIIASIQANTAKVQEIVNRLFPQPPAKAPHMVEIEKRLLDIYTAAERIFDQDDDGESQTETGGIIANVIHIRKTINQMAHEIRRDGERIEKAIDRLIDSEFVAFDEHRIRTVYLYDYSIPGVIATLKSFSPQPEDNENL